MCISQYVFVPLLKLFVRETRGFERIPKKGPAILVANHGSYIDAVLLRYFTAWYRDRLPKGIQSSEWLDLGIFRRFFYVTLLGNIPTNGSVEKALDALRKGDIIMLFPGGGRSPDGTILKAKHTGLGVFASETKAPVIPIGIDGSFKWWPRQRFFPTFKLREMTIKVGKAMRYSGSKNKKGYLAFQKRVMKVVAKLANKEYKY